MSNTTTKRNAAISATIVHNEADNRPCALALTFSNGETLSIAASQLTNGIIEYAVFHGLKQKLVDAAAISRNPETGRAATIEDKYNAVKAVYDRLLAGQWNAVREGGGNAGGLLFKALCRMYATKSPEDIRAYLDGKTDAEKTALRKNPRVATIIEELRIESGKTDGIDTDELLGELDD